LLLDSDLVLEDEAVLPESDFEFDSFELDSFFEEAAFLEASLDAEPEPLA